MKHLPTWRYTLGLARFAPWRYMAHGSLWSAMNLATLLPGLIARAIFDGLTGAAPTPVGAAGLVGLLLLVALGQMALWLFGGYVEIMLRFTVSGLVRRNLLGRVLARPGALALPFSLGEAISRFRDDAYQAEDNLDWTDEAISHGLFALVAFAILVAIDARMALAAALPLLAVVAIARLASAALERRRAASSAATSQVTGAIGDIVAAVQTVQAAGAEERVVAHFRRLGEQRRGTVLADRLVAQALDALTANTTTIGTGLVMLLAAGGLRDARLSVGDFVLFVAYIGFIADFTGGLGRYLTQYWQSGIAYRRMGELLDGTPPAALVAPTPLYLRGPLPTVPPPAPTEPLALLEARGLTYRHAGEGGERGIAGVDLRLPRGTLTVVTGRVGAGKTTLLRALLGLLPRQGGEIVWNGAVVPDPAAALIPPRAAYTAQVPRLFSETLRDNILLGLPDDPATLDAAVRGAALERDVAALEAGLATPVGTRGVKLSGGQVQRAAAARMSARGAELLVIDDLSSALDVETERLLWDRLLARGDATILAVSHRRAALGRADQIVVLKDGRVEDRGTLADLLGRSAELRALWREADDPADVMEGGRGA